MAKSRSVGAGDQRGRVRSWVVRIAAVLAAVPLAAQEWTDDELRAACAGFQSESLVARLAQVAELLEVRDQAFTPIVARLHGDHREYRLKIDQLLDQLADPTWQVREQAERTLIEIGGSARTAIVHRKENPTMLEQQIRCARVLEALTAKGTEEADRDRRLLRGLAATALYLPAEPRLLRALRSALGHTEAAIADSALRAIGLLGGDDEADAVAQMIGLRGGFHRLSALSALGRMRGERSLAICRELLLPPGDGARPEAPLNRTEIAAMIRALRARGDDGALALLAELKAHADPVVAGLAGIEAPDGGKATPARFTLPDRVAVEGSFGGLLGDGLIALDAFPGLPSAELSFSECDTIDFPAHAARPVAATRVFLNQGSLVTGELLDVDAESLRLRTRWFGDLTLPRAEIQGFAVDPEVDRLVGASTEHDRVRLRDDKILDGHLQRVAEGRLSIELRGGDRHEIALGEVAGVLLTRPNVTDPDATIYTRLDLVGGDRLIGFVADTSGDHVAIGVPLVGTSAIPLADVARIEIGVGGGAMWGFTLISDYSDNRIVEVDDQGREVFVLEEVFGAWDAECLDNGNLLITEFSVSRVQEIDRKGNTVWMFDELKNPYDADRLPNGNTLIADTFGNRVVEVDGAGKTVWSYAQDVRPYDCDRLANGNTLIADMLQDRVFEVDATGRIVWELRAQPTAHDADRLPNGNTLVTLRTKGAVVEYDRDGKIVWQLNGLESPSDADRLPNGHTLVAENNRVREFDRHNNEVWKKQMTWAVEVNRY